MHARHRMSGDVGRSNSMGRGRGRGSYYPNYRNFNRGFGRGSQKAFLQPPQPPRRGDFFMEAGRLAAEYLVHKGLLPANCLQGKWQNAHPSSHAGGFHEFRLNQDRENFHPSDSRTSALARLGNFVPDSAPIVRRFSEEFNQTGPRNYKGKRRNGSFRGYSSDWGRENGKTGPWIDRTRSFSEMEEGEDNLQGNYNGDPQNSLDADDWQSDHEVDPEELPSKSETAKESESEIENREYHENRSFIGDSLNEKKEFSPVTETDESKTLHQDLQDPGESEDGHIPLEEKKDVRNTPDVKQGSVEGKPGSECRVDLVQLCNTVKVPTKIRSSLTCKDSNQDESFLLKEKDTSDNSPTIQSENPLEMDNNSQPTTSEQHNLVCPKADISEVLPAISMDESGGDMDVTAVSEKEQHTMSPTFSGHSSFMSQEEPSQVPPAFGRCSQSVILSIVNESCIDPPNMEGGSKRSRAWISEESSETNNMTRLHDIATEEPCLKTQRLSPKIEMTVDDNQDTILPEVEIVAAVDQDKLFPKSATISGVDIREGRKLLSGSFKICDLNLTETIEIADSPDDLVTEDLSTLSVPANVDAAALGISTNKSSNTPNHFDGEMSKGKEIASIDNNDNYAIENRMFTSPEQKEENKYSVLDNFLSNPESVNGLSNIHDGYDLAFPEFLGSDISIIPSHMNDLQTEMSLHNEEVVLTDDDSIFRTLAEIPISFLGVWDQTPQDYGKPF